MSDWIERMEQRIVERDSRALAKRLQQGPLPYRSAEVLDAVPDVRAAAETLRADGEIEAADRLEAIIDDVQDTMKNLWAAINEAAEPDDTIRG